MFATKVASLGKMVEIRDWSLSVGDLWDEDCFGRVLVSKLFEVKRPGNA